MYSYSGEAYGVRGQEVVATFVHLSKEVGLYSRPPPALALSDAYYHLSIMLMLQNAQALLAHNLPATAFGQ